MLSYIGGKSRIGKWIVPYYPKDMETYVEPFGGMFWCYYNMDLDEYPNLKEYCIQRFQSVELQSLYVCTEPYRTS